ncbi:MAG: 2,5-dihydroxypyridine 5,6-dioxygenase, partial [Burkholderiaceae bacterium]
MTRALVQAWRDLLNLCRLQSDEIVVILVGDITIPDHLSAARFVITETGCACMTVDLGEPRIQRIAGDSTTIAAPTALTGHRPAIAALREADLVIDMMGLYRGSEQEAILAGGTRILLVKEPPDIFIRMLATAADKPRVEAAERRLKAARTMNVRSPAGTDLTVAFGEYPCLVQYGFADEPGRWDHAPSALIARWPDERSASGIVVLDRGDTILPFKKYVQSPITMEIEAGYVRSIVGSFDAQYLKAYMESFKDPEGFAVSHLGWGLHDRAHWTMLGMYDKQTNGMDARSYLGNFMFSTGPNAEAGGTRHTACHL